MTALIITICLAMLTIIIVQISQVRELSSNIRGEEESRLQSNKRTGIGFLVFCVLFLLTTIGSAFYYKDYILGYGPWQSASAHGGSIDDMITLTLVITGIVFILTHIALFYFAYRYSEAKNKKAEFISHDNKLEVIWTLIPSLVMTVLVIGGLKVWNNVMADVSENEVAGQHYMEIEATGYQFAWDLRYPGDDNLLGTRDFRLISGTNSLGQDWNDVKNHDDFMPSEIVLPVNVKVRVRITSKDVLHNFYLPQFRVKMDAVPGMPTYFVFTPTVTTEEMRQRLSEYPEYQLPSDPEDPESEPRWKTFEYELACAELCGRSHFSMRRVVRIVTDQEYLDWKAQQQSTYLSGVRNTDADPYKGQVVQVELNQQRQDLYSAVSSAMNATDSIGRVVRLENISYRTGSAALTPVSSYELDNVIQIMKENPSMNVEIAGHTDNVGDADMNLELSRARANSVATYLTERGISADRFTGVNGYGQTLPVEDNDTPEGRAANRRTEFIVQNIREVL